VREAVDEGLRGREDLVVDRVADVVRLAKVVPADDLDQVGLLVDYLVPAVVPQAIAGRVPVLVEVREACDV
jgi:hypothetical protein